MEGFLFLFVKFWVECACISIGGIEDIHKAFPGGRGKGTLAVYTPMETENVAENAML